MNCKYACIALLFLCSATDLQAQAPDVDGRRLTMRVDSLAIYLIQGKDTTRTGVLRDELAVVTEGNRQLIRRIYMSTDKVLGTSVDTLTDQLSDLRPVRHRSHSTRSIEILDFTAGRARGWMRLPKQATINTFIASSRVVTPLSARVVDEETIGGERCWRVQADFSGTPVTFWIGQTSRRLRQQVMVLRPDMQILFRTAGPPVAGGRAA